MPSGAAGAVAMARAGGRMPDSGEAAPNGLIWVPANARRLIENLQQARSGQIEEHNLAR